MASQRDGRGRFIALPREALSEGYRRRLERGAQRGRSLSAARGHGVKSLLQWQTSTVADHEGYRRALHVLVRMRGDKKESLSAAARAVGTTPDAVRRYAGSALTRGASGRYEAKASDRLYRKMKFLDANGTRAVEPANSREASKLGRYWDALEHYLRTGDDHQLRRFRRQLLRTRDKTSLPFLTDLDTINYLARAGELSFEDLYELAA
jgi:hypothetical protein